MTTTISTVVRTSVALPAPDQVLPYNFGYPGPVVGPFPTTFLTTTRSTPSYPGPIIGPDGMVEVCVDGICPTSFDEVARMTPSSVHSPGAISVALTKATPIKRDSSAPCVIHDCALGPENGKDSAFVATAARVANVIATELGDAPHITPAPVLILPKRGFNPWSLATEWIMHTKPVGPPKSHVPSIEDVSAIDTPAYTINDPHDPDMERPQPTDGPASPGLEWHCEPKKHVWDHGKCGWQLVAQPGDAEKDPNEQVCNDGLIGPCDGLTGQSVDPAAPNPEVTRGPWISSLGFGDIFDGTEVEEGLEVKGAEAKVQKRCWKDWGNWCTLFTGKNHDENGNELPTLPIDH
ncbi:hypothetical protein LTR78_009686 [Recurvomyces mirabilis]|uniref:Uncharacterized protein n=1 Tax=Recurvomyces mirabilis TaxID=574656 RepID=A0AAE0TP29_9PEZI|nr:hypothetical protein LTR78_009686 [Recurvomyces mirabilis]KAK5150272.1 hypothetical protein LTS14_010248 [Recurvomyces mirabilis]